MLIIVCGLQGPGKSTVAKKITEKINSVLLRTDVIRRELVKNPQYTKEEIEKTYNEMFSRTQKFLSENKNVILDATFAKQENRSRAKEIAKKVDINLKIVEVICAEDIIKKRIGKRLGDASRAQFKNYLEYKKIFEPIKGQHTVIDNSGTIAKTNEQLISKI